MFLNWEVLYFLSIDNETDTSGNNSTYWIISSVSLLMFIFSDHRFLTNIIIIILFF